MHAKHAQHGGISGENGNLMLESIRFTNIMMTLFVAGGELTFFLPLLLNVFLAKVFSFCPNCPTLKK